MMRMTKMTGVVVLGLCIPMAARADEAKGTIKSVETARNEVVLKGVLKDTIYELKKDGTAWLDGARCKLADLAADDRVVIYYETNGAHMMASSIRALRKAQETTGTVKDVFSEKHEITLKGIVKNSTYELLKDGTVWIDGKKGELADIREGDHVLITYIQRGDRYVANDVTVTKRK